MLEYKLDEAIELLRTNESNARTTLKSLEEERPWRPWVLLVLVVLGDIWRPFCNLTLRLTSTLCGFELKDMICHDMWIRRTCEHPIGEWHWQEKALEYYMNKIRSMFFSLGFQLKDMAFLRDQLLGVSLAVGRVGMDHKSGHW